jgi:hypothetical protein
MNNLLNPKPRYRHDCSNCEFLGQFEYEAVNYDLYFCGGHCRCTVIARRSSDPSDYASGLPGTGTDIPLAEALERANQKGLVSRIVLTGNVDKSTVGDVLDKYRQLKINQEKEQSKKSRTEAEENSPLPKWALDAISMIAYENKHAHGESEVNIMALGMIYTFEKFYREKS